MGLLRKFCCLYGFFFPIWCCLFQLGAVMLSACSSFILGEVLGGGSIDVIVLFSSICIVGFVWLIHGFNGLGVFNWLLQFLLLLLFSQMFC